MIPNDEPLKKLTGKHEFTFGIDFDEFIDMHTQEAFDTQIVLFAKHMATYGGNGNDYQPIVLILEDHCLHLEVYFAEDNICNSQGCLSTDASEIIAFTDYPAKDWFYFSKRVSQYMERSY